MAYRYNIIIPVAFREYPFLKYTLRYINKYLEPAHIFIITNIDTSVLLSKQIISNPQYTIIDENKMIQGLCHSNVMQCLQQHIGNSRMTGWYFQQFLKLGFALSDYCTTDYYLSWDADTLPIRSLFFFNNTGMPLFSMKTEHHEPYFSCIKRLFSGITFNQKSYIAEHMLFKKSIVKEMLDEIMNSCVSGNEWYEKIIYATDRDTKLGFSEFEMYGTYCLNRYPGLYTERELPSFRRGSCITGRFVHPKIIESLTIDTAIVSFELYDMPPFPWSLAHSLYTYYVKKWQLKKLNLIKLYRNGK